MVSPTWKGHGNDAVSSVGGNLSQEIRTEKTASIVGAELQQYFAWFNLQRVADHTRPPNISQPVIIYLGIPA
jgi:hypothetical protein